MGCAVSQTIQMPVLFRGSLAFLITALLSSLVYGQSDAPVTITADNLTVGERNGQRTQHLSGNVRFSQGSLYGSAEEATQLMDENRVELRGNVVIRQDTLLLEAPRVDYDGNTRIGHAEGGVRLSDRDNLLTASEGDYDMFSQVAVFHSNVRIAQGDMIITSNDLTYYRLTQTSVARGNVQVKSDTGTLRAQQITYVRSLGEMTAVTDVRFVSDSLELDSDWLYTSDPQQLMFARGRVTVRSKSTNSLISGDSLARFGLEERIDVPLNPLLRIADSSVSIDSITGEQVVTYDTTFVRSVTMQIFQGDSARFIATDSVRFMRANFSAIGGKMIYEQGSELIRLFQDDRQRLWFDSSEVVGDSIAIHLKDNSVERADAVGRSFTTSPLEYPITDPNDERIHQLQGERMRLLVERDTVRNMLVTDNALSIYFLLSDNKPDGVNRSSGDSIRLDFAGRAVKRVTILRGAEGEYWPEAFVRNRGRAFRLTAFTRNFNLRPRREEFVDRWELAATRP